LSGVTFQLFFHARCETSIWRGKYGLKKGERAVASPLYRNSSPSVGAKPTSKVGELQNWDTKLEEIVKLICPQYKRPTLVQL
jgi:hypothetical protein